MNDVLSSVTVRLETEETLFVMFMTVSILLQALALTSVISEICKLAHNKFF